MVIDFQMIFILFSSLFAILNPFGVIPPFLSLTSGYSESEKIKVIQKSMISAFLLLIVSGILGKYIIAFFGISIPAIRITGGVLVFIVALEIITGNSTKQRALKSNLPEQCQEVEDISVVPLTIPLYAGPGAISTMIALTAQSGSYIHLAYLTIALIMCITISYIILRFSKDLEKKLGKVGFNVLTKLMGLMLMAIAVQMLLDGIGGYIGLENSANIIFNNS
ncbi:MarC family protein [Methanococcus voltae]|uniref:UPF0056 membrane protein n=1 Tax=Methanococcus voltae (strain ATCC BAA-1334 / A3) TaxID=456320 RepID=D7DV32_METV3|nr:NAAT family transporter [Methanococcus voltae]MCS3900797.1 multiple antibiotic resistance protein [Methanococcus voltae]